jgi:hypothetical protein
MKRENARVDMWIFQTQLTYNARSITPFAAKEKTGFDSRFMYFDWRSKILVA